jgi:hypothetical protein
VTTSDPEGLNNCIVSETGSYVKLYHLSLSVYQVGKIPYSYRRLLEKYSSYAKKYKATMPIRRKPGEIMEVDWAGSTLSINDRASGEVLPAYIFVASLPYSMTICITSGMRSFPIGI